MVKEIPLILEQYRCSECEQKWYINTEDKVENKMICPYGCECKGDIVRKFDMMIHDYEEYAQEEGVNEIPTLDKGEKGGENNG